MDAPSAIVCPITQSVMRCPVVAPSGVSYERESLETWIKQRGTDPSTGRPLRMDDLYPNLAIREVVEVWASEQGAKTRPMQEEAHA